MAKFLTDVGMKPMLPEGGYFMLADWSPLGNFFQLKIVSVIISTIF